MGDDSQLRWRLARATERTCLTMARRTIDLDQSLEHVGAAREDLSSGWWSPFGPARNAAAHRRRVGGKRGHLHTNASFALYIAGDLDPVARWTRPVAAVPSLRNQSLQHHARLQRLVDDQELLLRRKPPPAGNAGDDFHLRKRLGHRRMTRTRPSSSGYRRCPVKTGGSSDTCSISSLATEGTSLLRSEPMQKLILSFLTSRPRIKCSASHSSKRIGHLANTSFTRSKGGPSWNIKALRASWTR